MARIRILVGEASVEMTAELNDSATSVLLWRALPLGSPAQTRGSEAYFSVPLEGGEEDAQTTVASGAFGYWPPGAAVCLFFGQQPVNPVNMVGALVSAPSVLEAVRDGHVVRLERIEE